MQPPSCTQHRYVRCAHNLCWFVQALIAGSTYTAGLTRHACHLLHLTAAQPCREINVHAFRCAHSEYKFCQMDLRLGLQRLNDLECPACSGGMAGVHVDANMKLFTWRRGREPWRQPHYCEFFAENQSVQLTLDALDLAMGSRVRQRCSLC